MATPVGKLIGSGIDAGQGLFRKLFGGAPQEGLQPTAVRKYVTNLGASDKSGLARVGAVPYRIGKYVGAPAALGLGGFGLGRMVYNGVFGDKKDTSVDYTALMDELNKKTGTTPESDKLFQAYIDAIKGAGSSGGGGGGGGMSASDYNYLAGLSNQAGGASLAAMQDLANTYGQTATGIRAGGEAGAQALRDIYGAAAAEAQQGSRLAGTAGSGLVPVSGAMAQLPANINRAGGTMADYLAQNELINAQSAGFLSNLSNELGIGYGRQVARQDQTFRRAQAAADRRAAAAASARNSEIQREANITAAQLQYERALQNQAKGTFTPMDIAAQVEGWKNVKGEQKKAFAARGITNAKDYALYMLTLPQTGE
jgi:hypothetical protein